jgi:hypothetical protein
MGVHYIQGSDLNRVVVISAHQYFPVNPDLATANAHLIAAAPELLDIARSILVDDLIHLHHPDYIERVRAVIAKAEGRS